MEQGQDLSPTPQEPVKLQHRRPIRRLKANKPRRAKRKPGRAKRGKQIARPTPMQIRRLQERRATAITPPGPRRFRDASRYCPATLLACSESAAANARAKHSSTNTSAEHSPRNAAPELAVGWPSDSLLASEIQEHGGSLNRALDYEAIDDHQLDSK